MNVEDAAHLIAHECDGGLDALAVRMGIGARVFNGKVNPNDKGHVLGLVESVRMQQLTERADILYAMADALGYVCVKRPEIAESSDLTVAISTTCAEFGDFMRQVDKTLKDRRVTRNEMKRVQKELAEMIGAANGLHSMLSALVK